MAGWASLIGGVGDAAGKYATQIRQQRHESNMAQWNANQKNLSDMLDKAYESAGTPERQADILATKGKLLKLKPGEDPTKVLQDIQGHLSIHPITDGLLNPEQQQSSPQPGITPPGSVPGMGSAAQPPTSPVQPIEQGGAPNPLSGLQASPPPTQQPAPVPSIEAAAQAPPVQAAAPSHMSNLISGGAGSQVLDMYNKFVQSGIVPPEHVRSAAQPYISNEAELARNKGLLDQQLTYKRAAVDRLKESGAWSRLQPWQQAAYEAETGGLTPVTMPGFAMTPRVLAPSTRGEDVPPGTVIYGTNQLPEKGKLYRVEMSPMSGETFAYPIAPQTTITQTPGGLQVSNKQTGGSIAPVEGAIPSVMNTPKTLPTAEGGVEMVTPSQVQAGVAPLRVPNAVTPSIAPTVRSSVTQQSPTGETVNTTSTRKVFGSAAAQPPSKGVSTHTADGTVKGTPEFQKQVQATVSALLQPNLSEQQQNTLFKRLVGPERSPMAEAVRTEIRNRSAQDPNAAIAWDIGTAERAQLSTQALQHVATIDSLINNLEKSGQLGPAMSRWNEFWTGKIGEDLSKNQDYVKLKNNVDLLTKLMGRIHGGARGGGSIQMIQSFANKLSVDKMDPNTLRGAIHTEAEWLSTYADPKHTALPQGSIPPVGGSNATPQQAAEEYVRDPKTGKLVRK